MAAPLLRHVGQLARPTPYRAPTPLPQDELTQVIGEFDPAPAELLEQRNLLRRTDSKFLLPAAALPEILAPLVDDHTVLLANGERTADYRTLYFDTPDFRCFHDHRRGRRPRHKIRVRHYTDRQISYLEVKTRRSGLLTYKRRMEVPYGDNYLGGQKLVFLAKHCNLPVDELEPAIWTYFERITLVSLVTNERVTIDLNLTVGPDDDLQTLDGVVIMEVKQSPFSMRTPIMRSLRAAGIRRRSASKYCTGMALTKPHLRMNRLRPALRALERICP